MAIGTYAFCDQKRSPVPFAIPSVEGMVNSGAACTPLEQGPVGFLALGVALTPARPLMAKVIRGNDMLPFEDSTPCFVFPWLVTAAHRIDLAARAGFICGPGALAVEVRVVLGVNAVSSRLFRRFERGEWPTRWLCIRNAWN